jgi:hypothetical protein
LPFIADYFANPAEVHKPLGLLVSALFGFGSDQLEDKRSLVEQVRNEMKENGGGDAPNSAFEYLQAPGSGISCGILISFRDPRAA